MTATPWVETAPSRLIAEPGLPTSVVVVGAAALERLLPEFDDWARHRRLPTTAGSSWLSGCLNASEHVEPWGVVSRDVEGRMVGLVLLLDEQVNGRVVTTLAGTDQGNRGVLTVETPEVAESAAVRVAEVLRDRIPLPQLLLGPLDSTDPSVHAFASALPSAQLVADDPIPVIRQDSTDCRDYLSQGMRRTLRKARNRLVRDQHEMTVHFTTSAPEIMAAIPLLEQCHRDRDHVHGRPSDLDEDRGRRLWHTRLRELSKTGDLELAVLQIDGQFAAHALGATDDSVYRVLEGRFVTEWARYSPGRLLEAAVLQRVIDDEAFTSLDWMTAVAPDKLLATNDADPMVLVHWVPQR
ncbi:MAG: GNAT family N-acetyltransferase [Actinomycetes bacterium]